VIEFFTFSLKNNFKSSNSFHNLSFTYGINVIYGESGVEKSELIKCLSGDGCIKSDKFNIKDISLIDGIQVIQQNPDMQIISNTIENELAFNFECNSNDTIQIQKDLLKI